MEHKIGLRFPKSQARTLRNIAQRIRAGDMANRGDAKMIVHTFERAAERAAAGEPYIVVCNDPLEAVMIADGFPRWGVVRPAIEDLTHRR